MSSRRELFPPSTDRLEKMGPWFGRMHFGDEPWWSEKSTWRQVAEFSRSNSFADVNLLNYTGDAFPRFLRSETSKEKQHGNSEREDRRENL